MVKRRRLTAILTVTFVLAFALHTNVSKASFSQIGDDVPLDIFNGAPPAGVDLYVRVLDNTLDDLVYFEFNNASTVHCSIEGIYFDDGSLLGIVGPITANPSTGGPAFSLGATPPDLPAGNNLVPPFKTTEGFLADSDPPTSHNGVEPGEWLRISFSLEPGCTIVGDVIPELNDLTLRIGLHVIAFPDSEDETSYSAVNPEPATLMLLAAAAGMAVFFRKKPPR